MDAPTTMSAARASCYHTSQADTAIAIVAGGRPTTQFSLLAELNGWTEHQKAAYLAISPRGSALTVITNLPKEQCRDYTALSGALLWKHSPSRVQPSTAVGKDET